MVAMMRLLEWKSWRRVSKVAVLALVLLPGCAEKQNKSRSPAPSGADTAPQILQTPVPQVSASPDVPAVIPPVTTSPLSADDACHKADKFICEIELAITRQTNELRGSRTGLTFSKKLGFAARQWSVSMGGRGRIGHAGFPRARMSDLQTEFGSTAGVSMGGENVAMTNGSRTDAEAVAKAFTRMWWNSPGHRRNMVGNHQAIGVGVFSNGNGRYYATQIFGRGE